MKVDIYDFMKDFDDPDLSDGAWQSVLMDAVETYNEYYNTKYDPLETWLTYVKLKKH